MAAEGTVRAILAIAIPSAAFTLLTNSYRIVNQYFIQDVSVSAQAAIGSSVFVLILLYASFEVIAAGAGPLIARATGAGDTEGRRALFGEALIGSAFLTASLMSVGIISAPMITHTLGLEGETAAECVRYLQTLLWTLAPLVLTPLIDQAFVSMGNARLPLLLHAVSLGLNIMLTPLLIHSAGLGIVGAALASNIAHGVAATIGIVQLKRALGLRWQDLRLRGQLQRIVRIGMPMALGTAVFAAVYWGMLKTTVSP
ncbi:MAG: MATE family efflux transporter, partial [Gammaproteobacteria bacterium]